MTFLSHFLASLRRREIRRTAIRELQSLPAFLQADLGFAEEQIPDVVEDLLSQSRPAKRRAEGFGGPARLATARGVHL